MYLFDTNVISELRKAGSGRAHAKVVAWASKVSPEAIFTSSIVILELEMGVLAKERSDPTQGQVLRDWLENLALPAFHGRTLPFGVDEARRCASLHIPDRRSERDAMIAATAMVHGLTVVTRNEKDFRATGVPVLNPWV